MDIIVSNKNNHNEYLVKIIDKENTFIEEIKRLSIFINPSKILLIKDNNTPLINSIKEIPNLDIYTLNTFGEEVKDISIYKDLVTYLLDKAYAKSDLVIAYGGGTVGDLTAFLCSTYKRGINFVNIPTTLLSMVDSSIGGKTALNSGHVKNAIGSFYDPREVIIYPKLLETLDDKEIVNGLMESLKMGIINDSYLYHIIKDNTKDTIMNYIDEIIYRSINIKKSFVENDPYDNSIRKALNFGHTIGHALELNACNLLHGEAVAIGMIPYVSNKDEYLRIISNYLDLPKLINVINSISKDDIISSITNDKKWNNNTLDVILSIKVGEYNIIKRSKKEIMEDINEIYFWE